MNTNRKKDLHRRYLTRALSEEELQEFFSMIELEHADDLADFDEVAKEFPTTLEPTENIAKRIISNTQRKKARQQFIQQSVAAAITIIMLFGGYQGINYYRYIQKTRTFAIVRVPFGRMTELTLEDSTVVTLTSGSVFKYPQAFTKTERKVYLLEGQGFFQVAHDKTKPFRVNSGKLSTTALGTSFVIRHYTDYDFEKVSLYTGKVQIDRNGTNSKPVILHPGQEFNYHHDSPGEVIGFNNAKDPIGTGTLEFRKTPFRDAMYSMASFYGIKINFSEAAFRNLHISGNFNSTSAEEILKSLTFIYPFKINKTDSSTYNLIHIEKRK